MSKIRIRDKGIAKLYQQALRSRKAKSTKKRGARRKIGSRKAKRRSRPQARKPLSAKGRAKAAHVMREFYHGELSAHGHRVARPDVAKAIAMSEGRAVSKPKRRRRRKSAKVLRTAAAGARKRKTRRVVKRRAPRVDHRVIRHAAPKARKTSKRRTGAKRKPSPAQLAARAKFVEMVRARAKDKKGPNRRK